MINGRCCTKVVHHDITSDQTGPHGTPGGQAAHDATVCQCHARFRAAVTEQLMASVATHSPKRKAKFLNQTIIKFLVVCMI